MNCPICLTRCNPPTTVPCGHVYCLSCISQWAHHLHGLGQAATCPLCRAVVDNLAIAPVVPVPGQQQAPPQPPAQGVPDDEVYYYTTPQPDMTIRGIVAAHPEWGVTATGLLRVNQNRGRGNRSLSRGKTSTMTPLLQGTHLWLSLPTAPVRIWRQVA